jgi:hypothetical protein
MVGSMYEQIYYSPDWCLKQNGRAREHGYSLCFGTFATSLEFLPILLMQIKMVVHECNLGHHLTDRQGAPVAHQGAVGARQGATVGRQVATDALQGAAADCQGAVGAHQAAADHQGAANARQGAATNCQGVVDLTMLKPKKALITRGVDCGGHYIKVPLNLQHRSRKRLSLREVLIVEAIDLDIMDLHASPTKSTPIVVVYDSEFIWG